MLLVGIMLIGLLAGCNNAGSDPLDAGGSGAMSPLTLEQAEQVAQTFLKAWEKSDYVTMYSLISPNARDAYTETEFTGQYTNAAMQITLNTLETNMTSSLRQGTTAIIQYDALFHAEIFGDITDNARIMRLIETTEGWRVAWSRMDIFADLAEGALLQRQQTLPTRGNIYDRNGQVLADQEGRAIVLWLVKQDMPGESGCINLLSRLMRRDVGELQETFNLYYPETIFFGGEIDPETYQLEEVNLQRDCGITNDRTSVRRTRRYFGELAPHLVGYVGQIQPEQVAEYERRGYPPDALIGQAGVEQSFEEYLAGKPGATLRIITPGGQVIREIASATAEPGQSVYLSIDRDLQEDVQNAIYEAYGEAGPTWAATSRGAAAVVMNVKTGEVLAMVSYPWFDPGLFNPDSQDPNRVQEIGELNSDPRAPLLNRVTMSNYPAGSVFKIVSTAAGLDSGIYPADTWYTCTAVWSNPEDALPQRTDWIYGAGEHGTINFQQALTYSCDPYFWELGVNLHHADPNLLPNYAYQLGLGVHTGQEVLPEEIGYIPNPEEHFRRTAARWALGDTANLVIGQGQMQITPLQITRMTAAIANGGTLWEPLLVNRVQLIGEDPIYTAQPTALDILDYDPSVFATIREAMCQVTLDPEGTARYMFEEWYNFQGMDVVVCGKTGTAQTGEAGVKPQAWFVAFAPQDDPEIAVTVIVENSCEGSEVAAPIVRRIVEDYYGMRHGEWPGLWKTGCYNLGN
jgi:penicillin-binding protein 2